MPPDTDADGHRKILDLLTEFTPYVQALPPLAALAQLNGAERLFGANDWRLAQRLRLQALAKYGIDVHVGIASTPATAATATATDDSGILLLADREAELAFLAPLPIRALHGVGPLLTELSRKLPQVNAVSC